MSVVGNHLMVVESAVRDQHHVLADDRRQGASPLSSSQSAKSRDPARARSGSVHATVEHREDEPRGHAPIVTLLCKSEDRG